MENKEYPAPTEHVVGGKCQYSEDVGMPEHRCAVQCQYAVAADALVKAERERCLSIVDNYHGGGRSFVMRKISSDAPSPAPRVEV